MKRRNILMIAGIAFAGLLGFRLYQQVGGPDAKAGPPGPGGGGRAQPVEAAVAKISTISERVSLVGSLRAKHSVEVHPKVSARVEEIRVDRGDHVKKGDLLARLDDDEIAQQVRRAEASLQVARASLAQRQAELKNAELVSQRLDSLETDGVVSSEQREQAQMRVQVAEAQVNLAEAQIAQAEADLEELRIRLGQTEIISPMTGVVGQRYVHPGALVNSNSPIVLILDLSKMVTVINVPEREINKIQVGNRARIVMDAVPGEELFGQVVRISPLLDSQTRTAPVEIELPNPSGRLKAEMFARVDLNLTTERQAVLIPRDALVYRSNRPGVFVIQSDVATFRSIETGLAEADTVEVVAGLEDGVTVVTRGANLIKNGDTVQILHPEGD